jgi:hypothetical protein
MSSATHTVIEGQIERANPPRYVGEAKAYFEHAVTLRNVLRALWRKAKVSDGPGAALLELDLLRCESLNALDRETRTRVLHKGYCVLVSMCPLGGREPPVEPTAGIPHYGPPTWEANSPWWKLFLASLVGPTGGPATRLYRKGERVRSLPAAIAAGSAGSVVAMCALFVWL